MKKNFRRLLRFVFILFFCLPVLTTDAYDIANLKGTRSILPPKLRELSVLDGAIAWNTGTIRRLYDLGHMQANEPTRPIREEVDNDDTYQKKIDSFKEELKKWTDKIESTSVKKVVRQLFYRPTGTTSTADFTLTKRITLGNNEFAKSMADVLSEIWLYHQISKQHGKVSDELAKKLLQFKLSDLLPGLGSVKAVKEALNDTVFDGYEVLRYSLLAALWVKCGSDREALKYYYEELKSVLPAKIGIYINFMKGKLKKTTQIPEESQRELQGFIQELLDTANELPQLDASWVNETFDKDPKPDLTQIKAFKFAELQDPANYELFTYFMLMPSEKPDDAPYDTAHLTINNGNNENIAFADCMDNVLRNLINHLAYDSKDTSFSVEKLREITGKTVNEKLIKFYATHSDAKKTTEQSAHNDWTDVISDIPWVEYCKVLHGESNGRNIKIPTNLTPELNGFLVRHGYRRVEEREAVAYEVQPCLRNIIIVLNYLLNLGIFEEKNLSEEFIRVDFVSTYLPQVFEKFGEISFGVADLDKFDFQESGSVKIRLPLKAGYDVDITITIRQHGEFSSKTLVQESSLMFSQMNSENFKKLPVSIQLLLPQDIFKKPGFNDSVESFFAQDIGNPSICSDLLQDGSQIGLNETKIKLLKFLISRNADANVRQKDLLRLYIQVVDAKMEKNYKEAIDEATAGIKSPDYGVRNSALDLWEALLEKGNGFKKAIDAAKEGMEDSLHPDVQLAAVFLWKALVENVQGVKDQDLKKQVFDKAIYAAKEGMKHPDFTVMMSALDLWKALFANVKGVEDKINVAKAGMTIPNTDVQRSALFLWKALFEKGEGFADAQKCLRNMPRVTRLKQIFEQLINEYKPKFEQASLANIVTAVRQPAVAAQVPAAK